MKEETKFLIEIADRFDDDAQDILDFVAKNRNLEKAAKSAAAKAADTAATEANSAAVALNTINMQRGTMQAGVFRSAMNALDGAMEKVAATLRAHPYAAVAAAVVALGIAVITPVVKFILGLTEWKECWSENTDHCITGKHIEAQALQILSGYEATKELAEAQEDENNTAVKLCWNYGYKGLQWYLPCLLELNAVCANKEEINELLKLVGGDPLSFDKCYWSSTENSAGFSWYVGFYSGYSYNGSKCNANVVRPAIAI